LENNTALGYAQVICFSIYKNIAFTNGIGQTIKGESVVITHKKGQTAYRYLSFSVDIVYEFVVVSSRYCVGSSKVP
jgi:hypothetical protein